MSYYFSYSFSFDFKKHGGISVPTSFLSEETGRKMSHKHLVLRTGESSVFVKPKCTVYVPIHQPSYPIRLYAISLKHRSYLPLLFYGI